MDSLTNSDVTIPDRYEPVYEPNTRILRKVRRLLWNDPDFWRPMLSESPIPELVTSCVGRPVDLIYHAAFLKPARIGSAVALHQDQYLWDYEYPEAVSVWIAIDPSMRENGCLIGCPGSHLHGEMPHEIMCEHGWHPGVDWMAQNLGKPLLYELDPGDALIMHRHFVHGSGLNRSSRPRCGVVMVFAARESVKYPIVDRYEVLIRAGGDDDRYSE